MNMLAIHIIGFIFILLTVFFQIRLSKKENKLLGLILPFITFVASIIFTVVFKPIGIEAEAIEQTASQLGIVLEVSTMNDTIVFDSSDIKTSMAITFLAINIWTTVLLFVYAICRTTRNNKFILNEVERNKFVK